MKNMLYNTSYFLKETKTIIKLNMVSNIFSLLSTGLIFFILSMVVSAWWVSNGVMEAIQGEAEISVYYEEGIGDAGALQLKESLGKLDGVLDVQLVNQDEAYNRMEKILGKEAQVLAYLDNNPFSPFIEVKIDMDEINNILMKLKSMEGIEHIRDNQEVLDRLKDISGVLKLLGFLIISAVGISTLVIIAHLIRMGIYNNREQIYTLRLLGAPEAFIAFPFLMSGILLTLGGGIVAALMAALAIKYAYYQLAGPLPFIPLPPQQMLITGVVIMVICLSAVLGLVGSLFGLSSGKKD